MSQKPSHLIERAAERLRQQGMLEDSSARMLSPDPAGQPQPPAASPYAPPPGDPTQAYQPPPAPPAPPVMPPPIPAAMDTAVPPSPAYAPPPEAVAIPAAIPSAGDGSTMPPPTEGLFVPEEAFVRAGMLDWRNTRNRTAEEFRVAQVQILRTAFAPEHAGTGANLVMVTSARPGEGKSFTSLNLATSIARQRDREVVLVDVDAKQDSIGALLGLSNVPGILDLAAEPGGDAEHYLVKTAFPKLSILPIGPQLERSAELFATRAMARIIRELGRRYADRIVILDAPPCLSSSDPSTMAPIVGQVVMLVEAGRTQKEEVEAALDLIQACPRINLLLNKVQLSTRHSFGAYTAQYGYGYGYGRYYSGRIGSGRINSGRVNSGRVDSGRIDSGRIDSGRVDSGRIDSGRT